MSPPDGASGDDLVARYLARLGLNEAPAQNLAGLEALMRAHLSAVPFENLDVFWQRPVSTDAGHSINKILAQGRGGWCFELNGAFAHLLEALGYQVRLLGAAVLLGGPNTFVDHLTIEVTVEREPFLVDVGFGDGFARPLPLNGTADSMLDGFTGTFGLMPGAAEGTTLVRYTDAGPGLDPQYRFRRVALTLDQLAPASHALYGDAGCNFRQGPVATRLIDGGPQRVTLTSDRLRVTGHPNDSVDAGDTEVEPGSIDWFDTLDRWFGIDVLSLPDAAARLVAEQRD